MIAGLTALVVATVVLALLLGRAIGEEFGGSAWWVIGVAAYCAGWLVYAIGLVR